MRTIFACCAIICTFTVCGQEGFGDLHLFTPRFDDPKKLHVSDLDQNGLGDIVYYGRALGGTEWATQWLRQTSYMNWTVEELDFINYDHELMVDIDQDGDTDQLYWQDGTLYQLPNLGGGVFGGAISHVNVSGTILEIADLNSDGYLDILTHTSSWEWAWEPNCTGTGSYAVYVHNGSEAGTFGEAEELFADSFEGVIRNIRSVSVGDLSGDGFSDLVFGMNVVVIDPDDCGTSSEHHLYRLDQTADGFSEAELMLELGYQSLTTLEVADMDGDTHLDILFGYGGHWMQNDGTGNFPNEPQDVGSVAQSHLDYPVQIDDMNNDGLLETLWTQNQMELVVQSSPGEFDSPTEITESYPTHNNGYTIQGVFADLDNNGHTDIVTIAESGDLITFHPGDGDDLPEPAIELSTIGIGQRTFRMVDLNGDDALDVVNVHSDGGPSGLFVTLSDGNDQLLPLPEFIPFPVETTYPLYLEIGDIDDNGWHDVVLGASESALIWYSSDGSGALTYEGVISSANSNYFQLADFTGDGSLDIAVWEQPQSGWENPLVVYSNVDGNGTFEEIFSMETVTATGGLRRFQVADVNGDGDMDVIGAWWLGNYSFYIENDGTGNFFAVDSSVMEGMEDFESIAVADFNDDGFQDIAYTGRVDGTSFTIENLYVEFNDGTGSFGNQWEVEGGNGDSRKVRAADFDVDGDVDLVFTQDGSTSLTGLFWAENIGGAFLPPARISQSGLEGEVKQYDLADMDGDDIQDVILKYEDERGGWIRNELPYGCTDESACNYDPDVLFLDDSCCFDTCGCTDSDATNYNPAAVCDNGMCTYAISGFVYNDVAADFDYDEGTDTSLAFEQVTIGEDLTVFTDDAGMFYVEVPDGDYVVSVSTSEAFPYALNSPQVLSLPGDDGSNLSFGLSATEPIYAICVDLYPSPGGFLCNEWLNYNICFRNEGNVPVSGVVEVEYDALFQDHQEVTPIDSINGNTVYMSFTDLPPGAMYFYDLGLLSPTVDFIGEYIWAEARITGYNDEGNLAAFGEETRIQEVTCAYDPNDKQAFPEGYSDDHLLLVETEQEFLVRFQNTGNAPAQDVVIVDTLDVNYDLDSFHIVANSHSMSAVVDAESREIRFQFYDIQLPDSTCCEPESHGLVSYTVRSLPDLDPGTVLENTAYIFFDNNDPIVTNTTWTQIHECQDETTFELTYEAECPGQVMVIESSYDASINWEQTISWTLGEYELSDDPVFEGFLSPTAEGLIDFVASNPLCTESGQVQFVADPDAFYSSCPADLNCDGIIGAADIGVLLGNYGCDIPLLCPAELDGNSLVDSSDLLVILGGYGTLCEE